MKGASNSATDSQVRGGRPHGLQGHCRDGALSGWSTVGQEHCRAGALSGWSIVGLGHCRAGATNTYKRLALGLWWVQGLGLELVFRWLDHFWISRELVNWDSWQTADGSGLKCSNTFNLAMSLLKISAKKWSSSCAWKISFRNWGGISMNEM